ncbi:MAG: hypothetical protein KDH19_14920 [Geminicoccaceae bacterium]|nr:hypothetical protein [Geminicoccaceae bacterium]MCB2009275.1 hypothetical protein [Geminicoccaceae bacterium]
MSVSTRNDNRSTDSGSPDDGGTEEIETFGAAGPILVFMFLLWGFTLAAAAAAVS